MTFSIDSLPYVGCSHQTPRGDAIGGAVVHTNEGPVGATSADNLADYLHSAGIPEGYHVAVGGVRALGRVGAIRLAQDSQRVNGAGGVNDWTLHICLTGRAAFTRAQWLDDPTLRAEIDVASDIVRQWSVRHGFPFRKITADEVARKVHGVFGHGDVHDPRSMGHTDPGAGFPWDVFMAGATPAPTPLTLKDDDMLRLIAGDQRKKEAWLTDWLVKRRVGSIEEAKAIIDAGVTDGEPQVIWPQAWVDAIPVAK